MTVDDFCPYPDVDCEDCQECFNEGESIFLIKPTYCHKTDCEHNDERRCYMPHKSKCLFLMPDK